MASHTDLDAAWRLAIELDDARDERIARSTEQAAAQNRAVPSSEGNRFRPAAG